MNARNMIFAPNLTGPLHLGNAVVLWLTAREAMQRNADLVIRLDDRYNLPEDRNPDAERASIESVERALDALGVRATVYRYSARAGRYARAFHALREAGLLVPHGHETYVLRDACCFAEDVIHGPLRSAASCVWWRGQPNACLAAVCDFLDFGVELHVRGCDLMPWSVLEPTLLDRVARVQGVAEAPRVRYAHIPMVADWRGGTLHKSDLSDGEYSLERLAARCNDAMELRAVLEGIVQGPPRRPFAWANVLRARQVDVYPHGGHAGGPHPHMRRDQFADEHYHRVRYDENEMVQALGG